MALLETPERVNAAVTKDQGRPNPRISSRDAAKVASGSSSPSTNRAWSPMSFIEQKLAGNPKTKDNLKRIGSWIDRAKSQIEELIESDER